MTVEAPSPRGLAAGPVAGGLWMTAAAILFAGMILCVRLLSKDFSVFEITFFRAMVGMVILAPVLVRHGVGHMRTKRLPLYLVRITLGYIGMTCYYLAIARSDMVDATTLNATVPLFAVLFAWMILKEPVGPRRAAFTLLGFAGTLVLLRPGFGTANEWVLLALASAAIYALTMLCIKVLARTEPATRLVMYMNLLMGVISLPLALWTWVTPGWADMPYVLGLGVFATVGHYCFSRACAAADASVVIPFDFLRLPAVALLGYLVFFTVPDMWTALGALIIFGAVILLARTEARQTVAAAAGAPLDPVPPAPAADRVAERRDQNGPGGSSLR